jgi:hypothetical protein
MTTAGSVTKLQRSFAYRLSRWFPSEMLRWMDLVSSLLDNLSPGGGFQAQVVYVSVGGSDTSGDGSFDKPYRTIVKAMSTITDADPVTKPYVIEVGPGSGFGVSISVKNGVTIHGQGGGGGNYNGAPQFGITYIDPSTSQVLDVGTFAGAGSKFAAIENCALIHAIKGDFSAAANTSGGAAGFLLKDVSTLFDITFVGDAASLANVQLENIYVNATKTVTMQNLGSSLIQNYVNDFGGTLTYTQSAAIQGFHTIVGGNTSTLNVTWTSALLANFISILAIGFGASTAINLTGDGAIFINPGGSGIFYTMSNAANRLGFGAVAGATMIGANCTENVINCTPTAARVLTIDRPNSFKGVTRIKIRNLATGFPIDLTFPAGTLAAGNPTYVPPSSEVNIIYRFNTDTWFIEPVIQSGSGALAAGISAAVIPADITAQSRIVQTLAAYSGVNGFPNPATRVVGTRAGGGSFKMHAINSATGADLATDNGTYDWHISGS